ncbi:MAG: hypothetical protein K8S56_00140, partial [Candidatus Cloacimonetes bacterium]|nr:hypothetical protein [Candidatus Cloacimonadota bacterium]
MKRYFLIFIILAIAISAFSFRTPASMIYGNSYLTRSRGAHAIYWNPANLAYGEQKDYVFMNTGYTIYNNSFSIETYNNTSGKYLKEKDKNALLSDIDDNIRVGGGITSVLVATSHNRIGYSIGT